MVSTLEKAQNEYEKLLSKEERLLSSFNSLSNEKKIKALAKIDEIHHYLKKSELIYLGKKMEQAGRDLAKAAKNISDFPGDVQDIIDITNNTPKTEKSLRLGFKVVATHTKWIQEDIDHALDKIERAYNEIFPDDDEDDEEEEFDPTEPPSPNIPPTGDDDEDNNPSADISIIETTEPPISQKKNDKVKPGLPNESDPFIIVNPDPFIEDPD
jgi:ElaB/YqjD/DUF883 family membrane-anchored ribosome-binding protein